LSRCSGRVAVAALFQTADEMRRVHRLAYRMRQLQESHARFGFESRAVWQEDPIWQPLPEVVERHHPGLDARWHPSVQRAVASFAPLFGIGPAPVAALPSDSPALLPPIIAPIPQ